MPMWPRSLLVVVLLVAVFAVAGRARAQSPGAAAAAQEAERAGALARAATLWEQAYEEQPSSEYLLRVGEVCTRAATADPRLEAAMTARALRAYRRFLLEDRQSSPTQRGQVVAAIRLLRQRQRLRDDVPVAGVAPTSRLVLPRETELQAATFSPQAPAPRAAPRRNLLRLTGAGLMGGAVLLAAGGGILIAQGLARADEAVGAATLPSYQEGRDAAVARVAGGAVCLGAALASAALGGALWLRSNRGKPPPPMEGRRALLLPLLAPGGGGLALGGAL